MSVDAVEMMAAMRRRAGETETERRTAEGGGQRAEGKRRAETCPFCERRVWGTFALRDGRTVWVHQQTEYPDCRVQIYGCVVPDETGGQAAGDGGRKSEGRGQKSEGRNGNGDLAQGRGGAEAAAIVEGGGP